MIVLKLLGIQKVLAFWAQLGPISFTVTIIIILVFFYILVKTRSNMYDKIIWFSEH